MLSRAHCERTVQIASRGRQTAGRENPSRAAAPIAAGRAAGVDQTLQLRSVQIEKALPLDPNREVELQTFVDPIDHSVSIRSRPFAAAADDSSDASDTHRSLAATGAATTGDDGGASGTRSIPASRELSLDLEKADSNHDGFTVDDLTGT